MRVGGRAVNGQTRKCVGRAGFDALSLLQSRKAVFLGELKGSAHGTDTVVYAGWHAMDNLLALKRPCVHERQIGLGEHPLHRWLDNRSGREEGASEGNRKGCRGAQPRADGQIRYRRDSARGHPGVTALRVTKAGQPVSGVIIKPAAVGGIQYSKQVAGRLGGR